MLFLKKYLLFLLSVSPLSAFSIQPENLRCENVTNPLGINESKPLLSWIVVSTQRNQSQLSYEIVVDDNLKDIEQLKGKVWSTGKVISSQSHNVIYTGNP